MAFKDKQNPINVRNMFFNVLCKAGDHGRAWRVKFVEGTVIGVPQQPVDDKGFRNLFNLAIGLGNDTKPVLRVHLNQGTVRNAFSPPNHDSKYWKVINSLFVVVRPNDGSPDVVCVNMAEFDAYVAPTATPTPTGVV